MNTNHFGVGVCFACIILLLGSCSSNNHGDDREYVNPGHSKQVRSWQIVDTVSIQVDSLTSSVNHCGQVIVAENDTIYIIFNANINALQAYSLNSLKLVWKIYFEKEGPHAVTEGEKFYYHNKDSIFFFGEYPFHKIVIANSSGKISKTIDINFPRQLKNYWSSLDMFNEVKYIPETNSICFPVYPGLNSYKDQNFYKAASFCTFNLETKELNTFGSFPSEFYEGEHLFYVFDYIEYYSTPLLKILYFHPVSDVLVYDLITDSLLYKYKIPSKYIKQKTTPFLKVGQDRPDLQQEQNYLTTEPFYVKTLTNQEGSYHYRIVKHRTELRYTDGRMRKFHDKKFSIMILDNQFRVIDEVMFEGGLFDFYQSLAVGDYFYLSMNNPLNKNSREDAMQFARFKLK